MFRHTMTLHFIIWAIFLAANVVGKTGEKVEDECGKNAPDKKRKTCDGLAFLTACFRGNNDRIEEMLALQYANYLLSYSEGPSAGWRFGYTGLIWAAEKNKTSTVKILVNAGAFVGHYTPNGITALYHSARLGNLGSVKLLLVKGLIVINTTVTYGEHNGTSPLLAAARNGHTKIVSVLLANGANPNIRLPETGYFPMYFAAKLGDQEMVKELIRVDAPVNLQTTSGVSALSVATAWGHDQTVDALLKDQADPNLVDIFKTSPLHKAAHYGYTNILKLLLSRGADKNAQNLDGKTPLHFAAIGGNTATITALLTACPSTKLQDKNGRTALEAAQREELDLMAKKTKTTATTQKLTRMKAVISIIQGYRPCNN